MPEFKTIRQSAAKLSFPEYRLRKMLQENRLPGVYCGSRFMVNITLLEEMLREQSLKQVTKRKDA